VAIAEPMIPLSSIFPEKLEIQENKCRTKKINTALLLMLAIDKGFGKNKPGNSLKI